MSISCLTSPLGQSIESLESSPDLGQQLAEGEGRPAHLLPWLNQKEIWVAMDLRGCDPAGASVADG